ncbi:MAG: penicillin-binding protein 2 [Candidatus Cloacimonetes bacterium]|mgnify:CR=1 FL=1|jgi:penicillin-binding protein 2|nr:penicillin-binding protein 2 [Candidatus Cloacimonadota bacterium]MDD4100621.1 penicillin-binding protein 2 [Candidatus Cloacimonadota bacterium]MDD4805797.1 penicillin-binding protein 2 [Candidatus Cloacimonadota bacterium]HOH59892.1 penicillin-binding protein 2 [Candidatus Cloacimonadota bacterium]
MNKAQRVFAIVAAVLLSLLIGSLFRLQVVKGAHYQRVAESNFVRIRRIFATRGEIYDQKYRPIVQNVPSHNLYLISGKIRNLPSLSKFLSRYFGIIPEDLEELVMKQRFKTYEEILLADNIDYELMLSLSEYLNYYPELVFRIGSTRNYLYPNHFSGYVGRINEEEYDRFQEEDYSLNSYIGKTGLERYYEVLLRGKDGREVVQVDAQGRSLDLFRQDGSIEPLNGLSLVLTVDNDLQDIATRAFPQGVKGAVVVSDVRTGGILAYVSKPDFDPNIFMQRLTPELWADLNRADKPMLDRVIHATYPPGSVFKPITAGMGLESGIVDRYTLMSPCVGGFQVGNRFFRCWSHAGHGRTSIVDALMYSCDVYFYDLSLKVDMDKFHDYAMASHMAAPTGIDLPNERRGFFPHTQWYRKTYGKNVGIIGHKVNLSIGQGEILCSPIQMNAYFAALANDGIWIQPHFLKQTVGRGRLTREQVQKLQKKALPLSKQNLRIIQEGLWAVCNAPGGTARRAQVEGATTYGKTGSAENSMGKTTHAWFCGYIVTDKPEIAVTVFMENAGGGGAMAAPVAKQIFDYYVGNVEDIRRPVSIPPQLRDGSITEAETDPAVEETVPEEVVPDSPAEEQE